MTVDLTLIADDPELAPVWKALHVRLCGGQDPTTIATVRVPDLSAAGIATLRSWLDNTARRRRGRSAVAATGTRADVPVRELLGVLGLTPEQLTPLVERAVGQPVVNRAALRQQSDTRRQDLWQYAAEKLPAVPVLLARMRAAGIGDERTEESIRHFIDSLATAIDGLPYSRPISLPKLSLDCAGDPHYFDLDTLPGTRLVAAVAELMGRAEPSRPDHIRTLLADAGILADRLWATVLLHHVQVVGDGPIDRRLNESTTPVALNLLDLVQNPPTFAPQVLTVVENPSVLEAAMSRGDQRPLACTSGHLRAVDHTLLQLATDQGVRLGYAGDIDAAGVQIAQYIAGTYGANVVAMDADTVRAAGPQPSSVALGQLPTFSDTDLSEALNESGNRAVYQEHDAVLDRIFAPTSGWANLP